PLEPYQTTETIEVAPPTPPPQQIPVQQPIDPYSAYPAPPAYGYQAPAAGPPATPSPPSYQQGYYLYPAQGQAPVYYAPPPNSGCCCCCQQAPCGYRLNYAPTRIVRKKWDGARRFSLGAHVGFLTLNQQVGNDQVTLGGAGFQLRLRSAGHWGFEASQSFLHGSYWDGAWQRDSFPFSLSLMFYIFPNRDAHHFNLYGLAGVGLVADSVTLNDENHQQVTQDFTELEVHAGVGAELRFKWFGIEADARYISLWRDDSSTPASYYGSVKGAPVQSSSYGVQGNLYLSLWF
ncbi:MAG TPA: outer membrane beta-barrel protein, partial [Polyangia bacterium]|nr:outer membrane beta-barrel protein [Polyangia bacterium]